jgi:hypothetical protein
MDSLTALHRRFSGMELPRGHSCIAFHWPHRPEADAVFQYQGVLAGEPLHQLLDVLLAEHSYPGFDAPVLTEITVFRHFSDGYWETEDHRSHLMPQRR